MKILISCFLLFSPGLLFAAGKNYAGALGGFAILSGGGRSIVAPSGTSLSLYKPQTGPALNVFAGRHLSDYLSVQGNFIWNANDVTLTSAVFSPSGQLTYQQERSTSQQSFVGDLLLYFRSRTSWVRPYLSAGGGFFHFSSTLRGITTLIGAATPPPETFTAFEPALRVAVGADLKVRAGWSFRYSFSEVISPNPIGEQLTPPGNGNLKNFQNLFGFVKSF